jgi:hypothetical protein
MKMKRGDYVRCWWDTGAMGSTFLYGQVIEAGPRTARIRWESSATNRVRQDDTNVTLITSEAEQGFARGAMLKAEPVSEAKPA